MAALTLLLELEGLERVLGVGWGMPWLVKRNFLEPWVVSVFFLHLVPRSQ